jgi:hypothetical protein
VWSEFASRISFRALRGGLICMVVGAGLFAHGCREERLAGASSRVPETIALEKLIARGPDGNPNIVLTNYRICPNFVYERRTVGGQMVGDWTKVWVPIVADKADANPLVALFGGRAAGGDNVQAIICSTHVSNEQELTQRLGKSQLRGMVTNRISSLNSKEKELLRNKYPSTNFDSCLIIEDGREPSSSDSIAAYNGGGALLFLLGIGLIVKRFVFE